MIRYALRCDSGHEFESWFQSSSAYDSQREQALVTCPACNSENIEKAIMAPRIARKEKSQAVEAPVATSSPQEALVMAPQERELLAKLKELRDHVVNNADNVGKKFPDEARKIHYGDIEPRAIYGEATPEQARELIEEGVDVAALPVLPADRN